MWKAWHTELNKHVAVKILKADCAATGKEVRQFMVESRTMSSLHHPGIVQGYGAEYSNGHYALIMDYVDGYSFASLMNRKHQLPQIRQFPTKDFIFSLCLAQILFGVSFLLAFFVSCYP